MKQKIKIKDDLVVDSNLLYLPLDQYYFNNNVFQMYIPGKIWPHLSWPTVLESYSQGAGYSDGHNPQSSKTAQGSISCQE